MAIVLILQEFDALSPDDPYGDTPFRHETFDQNGSGKINCATEKRRRSAAFGAKSGKAFAPMSAFLQPFRERLG
jgi:hypothetical protein